MNTYFAKYLPVEGHPATVISGGLRDLNDIGGKGLQIHDNRKLYLCSRDIKEGDRCCNLRTGEYFIVEEIGYVEGLNKNEDDFAVIGEISPNAAWVTEGMEFDEDEILTFIMLHEVEGSWKEMDGFRWSAYPVSSFVGIKCKCCNKFS
jgi:hypothetical protein